MRRVRTKLHPRQSARIADLPIATPRDDGTVTLEMIQALIPLGLRAVEDALQGKLPRQVFSA